MARSAVVVGLVLVWAGLFAMSVHAALTIPPTGDGFTRGINRASAVLTWQGAALLAALAAVFAGVREPDHRLALLARTPLLVQIALAVGLVAAIAFRMLTR